MKLASLLLGTLLATTGTAAADEVLHPPGGAVVVEAQRAKLRRAILEAFDANGDGRLEPRERRRAVRALRRMEHRLAMGQRPRGPARRRPSDGDI